MCMQDIRIGQSLKPSQRAAGISTIAAPIQLMTGDPNRARVVVSSSGWASVNNSPIAIRADGPTGPNLAAVCPTRPSLVLTVEEFGPLILGQLWAVNTADNGVTVDVSDLVLTSRSADA